MESRSFPSSFDIARRYAKHWKQYYLRYGEQGDNLARFRTVSDGSGFTGVDPLAEKFYNTSPYVYCHNNPINRVDPDGMDDSTGTPSKKNKNGVDTTPQSTTAVKVPKEVKKIPIKPVTALQAAAKIAKTLPREEIKDANQEKFKEMHNEAMNDPIKKQCLIDPVLQTSASIVLGGGAVAAAKAVAPAVTPLVFKSAQIALENPNITQRVLGVGIGVFVSTLTGQMQDVPQFTTGLPMVDNWSQISQAAMTSVDFFSSIAPQTNVQPVNNADNEKK